jgi:hypothetical protein
VDVLALLFVLLDGRRQVQEKFVHVAEVKVCEYVLFGDQVLPVLRCVASTNNLRTLMNFYGLLRSFRRNLELFSFFLFSVKTMDGRGFILSWKIAIVSR